MKCVIAFEVSIVQTCDTSLSVFGGMQNTLQVLVQRFGMNIKVKRQYLGHISQKKPEK